MSGSAIRIIIVNYRTGDMVVECLRSLEAEAAQLPGMRVVVVDNASGDDSARVISKAIEQTGWSRWASVMPLSRNGGFAAGNNAGIRAALAEQDVPDYFMLLNPDTEVREGGIAALLEFMERTPRAGIAGSRLEDETGAVQRAAHRAPSPVGELVHTARFGPVSRLLKRWDVSPPPRESEHLCDWVSGAAMLIRREVVEGAGLLDEEFFLYFEEVDLCCRARRAGWEVWYVPASCIVHKEGASTGISDTRRRRGRYWYDSRRRFFLKHYGTAGLIAADVLWATGRSMLMARRALRLGGSTAGDPKRYALDLLGGDVRACLKAPFSARSRGRAVEG